jgi:VanZ family protein
MVELLPHTTYGELSAIYVVFRKTWHFIEYAILAALLYRGLRAGRPPRWQKRLAVAAGLIAWGFGFLDEFLQSFVPGRRGSPFDWAVDTAGLLTGLALVFFWARRKKPEA